MEEGQKMAGTFAGSVAHPQVDGRGCMEHPSQCVQLIDPSFSMQSSLSIGEVQPRRQTEVLTSSTKAFEGNNKKATKVTKENKEKHFSFID